MQHATVESFIINKQICSNINSVFYVAASASEDDKLLMKAKMNFFGTALTFHPHIVNFIGALPDGMYLLHICVVICVVIKSKLRKRGKFMLLTSPGSVRKQFAYKYVHYDGPFSLRTLLYGDDNLDFTENKRIITETLRFINDSNRFA